MSPRKQAASGSPPAKAPQPSPAAPKSTATDEPAAAAAVEATPDADENPANSGAPAAGTGPVAGTDPASADSTPEVVFTYRSAGQSVAIFWRGRQVKTVGGAVGATLRRKLAEADEPTAQGLLARASGNFKRGTEHQR